MSIAEEIVKSAFDKKKLSRGVMYNIICIDKATKEWRIIERVETKRQAIEWIEANKNKYPGCILNFAREGFEPIIEIEGVIR